MAYAIKERKRAGAVLILELRGRLTLGHGSAPLDEALQRRIADGEQALLLDVGSVTHIDSQGIASLVRGWTSIRRRGGRLKLLRLGGRVRQVLELTRLTTVIESFDDEQAALCSFD